MPHEPSDHTSIRGLVTAPCALGFTAGHLICTKSALVSLFLALAAEALPNLSSYLIIQLYMYLTRGGYMPTGLG